ncbi:AraC family transcriptional regulator [Chryseobacterium sp. G0186]|uniref:helix-turn-helix domain-containing protein n=1 Tax=Chryseobacterium sp. G0186 TaxID=2487064 RepID=UPI000F501768|nr:AraC family transcriptional regulator [Chryseobacterium sp. G0186]AZA78971.1 AraC family transcriptional regulator [Chryseobacterium sp. G0186]
MKTTVDKKKEQIDPIEKIKLELIDNYLILMFCVSVIYFIIFRFYIYDAIMSWYVLAGILVLNVTYLLVRKKNSPDFNAKIYLILAPIYNIYLILEFWENSAASISWLLPLPLAAFIFFPKKTMLLLTGYTLLIIVISVIIANTFSFNFSKHTHEDEIFLEIILFISNILVITLLIYYKDKINSQKTQLQADRKAKKIKAIPEVKIDIESLEKLYERIESIMNEKMLFKDEKFNLSSLSVILQVNSSYISKAIRFKKHQNFNAYLNTYRIKYVKKLFTEVNFQKATLMYIYTEAGFSNQSTFNRVFKQIEGITPSEYIQQNLKIDPTHNA